MTHRAAVPASMTATAFFGTDDLHTQLRKVIEQQGWYTPAHLVVDVCARALAALEGKPT